MMSLIIRPISLIRPAYNYLNCQISLPNKKLLTANKFLSLQHSNSVSKDVLQEETFDLFICSFFTWPDGQKYPLFGIGLSPRELRRLAPTTQFKTYRLVRISLFVLIIDIILYDFLA